HLEQAHQILTELAPSDDHGREVGLRGSRYLTSAGHRALARGDMRAAANLLQRAASLRPSGDRERPRLILTAAEATIESGNFSAAEDLATSGIEEAERLGDRGLEATGQLVLLDLRLAT